mgnify:FL=1
MNKIDFPRKDVDGKEWSKEAVEDEFYKAFYKTIYDRIGENLGEINPSDFSHDEQRRCNCI